jgi:hypothetical protein
MFNADPGRESQAEETRLNNNLTTEEMITAAAGGKHIDILRSKARIILNERQVEKEFGLKEGELSRKGNGTAPKQEYTEEKETTKPEDKEDAKNE